MDVIDFSDRRFITAARSFDSNSTSTTLRETRIDNRIERSSSMRSSKYNKLPPRHQDSLDDVPDLSNNNQDVSEMAHQNQSSFCVDNDFSNKICFRSVLLYCRKSLSLTPAT